MTKPGRHTLDPFALLSKVFLRVLWTFFPTLLIWLLCWEGVTLESLSTRDWLAVTISFTFYIWHVNSVLKETIVWRRKKAHLTFIIANNSSQNYTQLLCYCYTNYFLWVSPSLLLFSPSSSPSYPTSSPFLSLSFPCWLSLSIFPSPLVFFPLPTINVAFKMPIDLFP